jgi:hypothetical protein
MLEQFTLTGTAASSPERLLLGGLGGSLSGDPGFGTPAVPPQLLLGKWWKIT